MRTLKERSYLMRTIIVQYFGAQLDFTYYGKCLRTEYYNNGPVN